MSENVLKINESKTGSKFIDLKKMDNGDTVVLTKKFDDVASKEFPSKFGEGTWTSYFTKIEYNGTEAYLNFKGGYSKDGYVAAEDLVQKFNEVGKEGDKVLVTMVKGMGKDKKDEDVVTTELTFEKVE